MTGIESVKLREALVRKDIEDGGFTDEEVEEILGDIDKLEENLVTWGRSLTDTTDILTTQTDRNIYKRRQGQYRSFFVRDGATLYCIGVGGRDTVYDRDLDAIEERAERLVE